MFVTATCPPPPPPPPRHTRQAWSKNPEWKPKPSISPRVSKQMHSHSAVHTCNICSFKHKHTCRHVRHAQTRKRTDVWSLFTSTLGACRDRCRANPSFICYICNKAFILRFLCVSLFVRSAVEHRITQAYVDDCTDYYSEALMLHMNQEFIGFCI